MENCNYQVIFHIFIYEIEFALFQEFVDKDENWISATHVGQLNVYFHSYAWIMIYLFLRMINIGLLVMS